MARHVRKGDMVLVVAGDDAWVKERDEMGHVVRKYRNRTPRKVMRVLPKQGKVVVEGVNVVKRHERPSQRNQRGGVVEKEKPIDMSNVMPVADDRPTRVRFETRADGSKVRLAARTGEQIGPPLKKTPYTE